MAQEDEKFRKIKLINSLGGRFLLLDPTDDLLDVTLLCSDKVALPANKTFLSARSEFFSSTLHLPFKESGLSEVTLSFPSPIVKDILSYMYMARSEILSSLKGFMNAGNPHYSDALDQILQHIGKCVELAQAADFMQVEDLQNLIVSELERLPKKYIPCSCALYEAVVQYEDSALRGFDRQNLARILLTSSLKIFGLIDPRPVKGAESKMDLSAPGGRNRTRIGISDFSCLEKHVLALSGKGISQLFTDAFDVEPKRNTQRAENAMVLWKPWPLSPQQQERLFIVLYAWATSGNLPAYYGISNELPAHIEARKEILEHLHEDQAIPHNEDRINSVLSESEFSKWKVACNLASRFQIDSFDTKFVLEYVEMSHLVRQSEMSNAHRVLLRKTLESLDLEKDRFERLKKTSIEQHDELVRQDIKMRQLRKHAVELEEKNRQLQSEKNIPTGRFGKCMKR